MSLANSLNIELLYVRNSMLPIQNQNYLTDDDNRLQWIPTVFVHFNASQNMWDLKFWTKNKSN